MASADHTTACPTPKVSFPYEKVQTLAEALLSKTTHRPEILIVAGSGLGFLGDHLGELQRVHYHDLPGFPHTSVAGHKGCFAFGKFGGKTVAVMQGRLHCYEGYHPEQTTVHIRMFWAMGVRRVLLTNAAGGLNPQFKAGDIMIMNDHINIPGLAGFHPLAGPNDERYGPRFPAVTNIYRHTEQIQALAKGLGMTDFVRQGCYVFQHGPTYETIAESKMVRAWGADAAGMSTVPEVVVATHCGMDVVAMSLITNMAKVDPSAPDATHAEVLEMASSRAKDMERLVSALVERWEMQGSQYEIKV